MEMKPGQMRDVVVDLTAADGRRSIYFIDLACVPVLHAKDGKFAGTLTAAQKAAGRRDRGHLDCRDQGQGALPERRSL